MSTDQNCSILVSYKYEMKMHFACFLTVPVALCVFSYCTSVSKVIKSTYLEDPICENRSHLYCAVCELCEKTNKIV